MRTRYLILPLAMALASGVAAVPLTQAQAAIGVTITVAPPALPVYEQPPIPGAGYLWTPGYWAWGDEGYYWVPGTWVEPPQVGMLWTPGYWGYQGNDYVFNAGYWGPTVGFYGGIDYGFGYTGDGFYGGRWENGRFAYNTAAWNIGSVHVDRTYRQDVARRNFENRVSFNGGNGGIQARATAAQERLAHERHVEATAQQRRQVEIARQDPRLRAATNHGRPPVAATARAGDFKAHPVAATNAETRERPGDRNAARPGVTNPAERNAARPGATPAERNAAERNAVQRKATEHNAVERNAQHNAAERNAAERNAVQRKATEHNAVERNAQHNAAERNAAERNAVQRKATEHNAVERNAQHNAAERTAVEHNAAERNTARPANHPATIERNQIAAQPRSPVAAPPHQMARPAAAPHPMATPARPAQPAARPAAVAHPAPARPAAKDDKK